MPLSATVPRSHPVNMPVLSEEVRLALKLKTNAGAREAVRLHHQRRKHESAVLEFPSAPEGVITYQHEGRIYNVWKRKEKKGPALTLQFSCRRGCSVNFTGVELPEGGGIVGYFATAQHSHAGTKYKDDDKDDDGVGRLQLLQDFITAVDRRDGATIEKFRRPQRAFNQLIGEERAKKTHMVYVEKWGNVELSTFLDETEAVDYVGSTESTVEERFIGHSQTNLHEFSYHGQQPKFRVKSSRLMSEKKEHNSTRSDNGGNGAAEACDCAYCVVC